MQPFQGQNSERNRGALLDLTDQEERATASSGVHRADERDSTNHADLADAELSVCEAPARPKLGQPGAKSGQAANPMPKAVQRT